MILALPLMELRNLAIDPQLARAMQSLYEDMAHRYLDMSALLRTYVAHHRRKVVPEDRPAGREGATRARPVKRRDGD